MGCYDGYRRMEKAFSSTRMETSMDDKESEMHVYAYSLVYLPREGCKE
jgi:hypothetical protein